MKEGVFKWTVDVCVSC